MTKTNEKPKETDDDTTELESRFNRNLQLRSHPELKPYVTETYRVRYGGLLKQFLSRPSVKKNLSYMHAMAASDGVSEQFVHNEADNIMSASDILNFNTAKASGVLIPENDKVNLIKGLRASLTNDGLEPEFIDAIVNQFDGELTCEEYVSVFVNLHLLKSCGFFHERAFFALLQDVRASGDRERIVELTARWFVGILKSNDNFNSDGSREDFLKNIQKFANRAPLHKPEESLVSRIGPTGLATLNSIRLNAIFNVRSCLASEKKKEKVYTALEVYGVRDSFPTLKYTAKSLEKLAKAISQASKEPISLTKSFNGFPCLFNCFICPSGDPSPSISLNPPSPQPSQPQAPNDEPGREGESQAASSSDQLSKSFHPPISFTDKTVARFNVNRLEPKNSRSAVEAHFVHVHTSLTQAQVNDLNGHFYIFFCPECLHNNFCDSIICCASHYEDHNKILHASTITHFRVLTKLREVFKDDSSMIKVIDKYLLTVCNFCKLLFPDKEARDTHTEKVCIPRNVSLCTYFGEPITPTPSFKTYSTVGAEKQERVTHLVQCLRNIAKYILKGPQSVSPDHTFLNANPLEATASASVGSTLGNAKKKLDLFSTLVLNETQMDICTFDSPRSPSPAPSVLSGVSTEPAVLSSKASTSTKAASKASTIPATMSSNDSDSQVDKEQDAQRKTSKKTTKQPTKTEKRREFHFLSKEAVEAHRRGCNADDDDDDDDDENDDENEINDRGSDGNDDAIPPVMAGLPGAVPP